MTEQNKHINEDLLVKFLLGEASSIEMQQVTDWLLVSDENQRQLDRLEMVWMESDKLSLKPVAVDIPNAWEKMSTQIDEHESALERNKIIDLRKRAYRFTASIAALLMVGFAVFQLFINTPINEVLLAKSSQIIRQELPDGTEIALNENSEISYPKKFKGNTRVVQLKGEAFFKVEPDKQKAFIVEAGDAHIKVLGTQFNVKTNSQSEVEVTVTEGRVELCKIDTIAADTNSIVLTAGNKGLININAKKPILVNNQEPDELFWNNKTLIFTDTELSKVILLLEKNFGITVSVSNPVLYQCPITTTFSNSNADEILEIIAFTFDLDLQKDNNNYLLEGNGCASN